MAPLFLERCCFYTIIRTQLHTALPAIKHLIDYLHEDNQISKYQNLEMKNMLSNHIIDRQRKGEFRFLSYEHINFILSDHVKYRFEH